MDERVTAVDHDASGVTVTTNQGKYHADKAVVSTGAWIADFLPAAQASSFVVYRQVFYWFAVDDPAQFACERFPFLIWIGDRQEEFYSAFPHLEGETVGLKMVTEEYIDTSDAATVDRTVHPHEIERMYNDFATRRINGLRPDCLKTSVCLYTNTPDEHFVIDQHPESDRILVASPCSGHGFKHSAAIGETLAQLALEGKSKLDISLFRFARLQDST